MVQHVGPQKKLERSCVDEKYVMTQLLSGWLFLRVSQYLWPDIPLLREQNTHHCTETYSQAFTAAQTDCKQPEGPLGSEQKNQMQWEPIQPQEGVRYWWSSVGFKNTVHWDDRLTNVPAWQLCGSSHSYRKFPIHWASSLAPTIAFLWVKLYSPKLNAFNF